MIAPVAYPPDTPYCSACGYNLTGAIDSSKCPECGKPLVEVLKRSPRLAYKRWQSKQTLFGLPLISIASGPAPGERFGKPVGIIAIGDFPLGVLAIGGIARGFLCFGGICLGVFSFGGTSAGLLLASGGIAVAPVAFGGVTVGLYCVGATNFFLLEAWGAAKIKIF